MKNVIKTKIVGISHHQSVVAEISPGEELELRRDKLNPFDINAIQVISPKTGHQLGFIQRFLAFELASALDNGVKVRCTVIAITGNDTHTNKGVNVELKVGEVEVA